MNMSAQMQPGHLQGMMDDVNSPTSPTSDTQ